MSFSSSNGEFAWPSLSIVQVAYNRRDELRMSLRKMLESDYAGDVEFIVVDNASQDDTSSMVREEFPQVRLIERDENIGAPAWNDGFAIAKNDWVLILDDDCYLPPDGLTRALRAAVEESADLVSFKVVSTVDPNLVFTENYRTGLFMFWGCAALVRTPVIRELGGYDPELFMWANELELTMRLLDRGYKHLHFPEVVAQHMKAPGDGPEWVIDPKGYKINANHWGYIAAKLMHPRDAVEALVALLATCIRDGLVIDRPAFLGIPETLRGFAHGLRCRQPLRTRELSRFYRRNFITFASPWWLSRPVTDVLMSLPRELSRTSRPQGIGRREQFFADRAALYPLDRPGVLKF